jgi:hypothetical protein
MPKKKKPKAVMVDDISTKPISPAEHRRLERRIKKEVPKAAATVPGGAWQESGLDFALT